MRVLLLLLCGSQPASDGGLPADQSLTDDTRSHCGSMLARESGLPGTMSFRLAIKSPDAFAVRALSQKDRSLRQRLHEVILSMDVEVGLPGIAVSQLQSVSPGSW